VEPEVFGLCCGMSRKLLLWDIDGTLVNTGRAGELALGRALEELGLPPEPDVVEIAGRTDRAIVRSLLQHHGRVADDAAVDEFCYFYLKHLPACLAERRHLGYLYPGISELLEAVEERGWVQGLVTGNLRRGAEAKLSAYGVWERFPFGGFADDSEERNDLPAIAAARALHFGLDRVAPSETWIIGDTPRDVACAKHAGFRCLAVATGSFSEDVLRAAGADVVMENFSDVRHVLDLLCS